MTDPHVDVTVGLSHIPISKEHHNVDGAVCERFFLDSGADLPFYNNPKYTSTFNPGELRLQTVVHDNIKAEGWGKMELFTSDGHRFPGFNNVIFSQKITKKIASVAEICEDGMVCVFDKNEVRIYDEKEVNIIGKPFHRESRDPDTRLYPLSLFRKSAPVKTNPFFPSLAFDVKAFLLGTKEKPKLLPGSLCVSCRWH
jgi:hypothetical protein